MSQHMPKKTDDKSNFFVYQYLLKVMRKTCEQIFPPTAVATDSADLFRIQIRFHVNDPTKTSLINTVFVAICNTKCVNC